MKLLIIDNYDSFTYNLYQYFGEILLAEGMQGTIDVIRNTDITLDEIRARGYQGVVLSPGPGDPSDKAYFGVCADVLTTPDFPMPVLGVCLGMQGIAHYFGGHVVRAALPMHGKTSTITHDNSGVFAGLPQDIEVMRYHSLVAKRATLPPCLTITAETKEGDIMGLRHREKRIEGIQFHPESFATEGGKQMLHNFIKSLQH
jgi:anthranilate synthase component 2